MWPTLRRIARRAAPWLLLLGGIYWISAPGGPAAEFRVGSSLPELTLDVSDGSRLVLPAPQAAGPQVLVLMVGGKAPNSPWHHSMNACGASQKADIT